MSVKDWTKPLVVTGTSRPATVIQVIRDRNDEIIRYKVRADWRGLGLVGWQFIDPWTHKLENAPGVIEPEPEPAPEPEPVPTPVPEVTTLPPVTVTVPVPDGGEITLKDIWAELQAIKLLLTNAASGNAAQADLKDAQAKKE